MMDVPYLSSSSPISCPVRASYSGRALSRVCREMPSCLQQRAHVQRGTTTAPMRLYCMNMRCMRICIRRALTSGSGRPQHGMHRVHLATTAEGSGRKPFATSVAVPMMSEAPRSIGPLKPLPL